MRLTTRLLCVAVACVPLILVVLFLVGIYVDNHGLVFTSYFALLGLAVVGGGVMLIAKVWEATK